MFCRGIDCFPASPWSLLLHRQSGSGQTMFASAVKDGSGIKRLMHRIENSKNLATRCAAPWMIQLCSQFCWDSDGGSVSIRR